MRSLNFYRLLGRNIKFLVFKRDTVGKTSEQMAVQRRDEVFLLFEDEKFTFDEFNRRANRRANLFRAMGVGKGDVICLMMENRPEFLETLVGLAKLGAVTAAINTNIKGQALVHSLKVAQAKKAIVGAECVAAFKEAMGVEQSVAPDEVFIDTRWQADTQRPAGSQDLTDMLHGASEDNPPRPALRSNDLFMYIYTSGTTGLPKAARVTHWRWFAPAAAFGWYGMGVRPDDTVYCALPLYHSNGALIAFGSALYNGAKLALSRKFSATRFWEEVNQTGATCFIYIGEVLRYLVNSPPGPYDRNHKVDRILGNGLRPDIWEVFRKRFGVEHIREFYASTEGNAATLNMNDVVASVGKPVLTDNLAVLRFDVEKEEYLRDEAGFCIRCDSGEVGALVGGISAALPFSGYTNSEETEKKLLRDVFKAGDSYFKTGDLLKKDADGNYFFVDRIGDTFRWKGENVSTHEVAEILSTFPGVSFVTVFGVEVPATEGRVGMAAVTMEKENAFDPQAFYRFTEDQLPGYSRPAFLRLKPELEVTGTFKLLKVDLKHTGYNPELVSDELFFRQGETKNYVPLDKALFDRIQSGSLRL